MSLIFIEYKRLLINDNRMDIIKISIPKNKKKLTFSEYVELFD